MKIFLTSAFLLITLAVLQATAIQQPTYQQYKSQQDTLPGQINMCQNGVLTLNGIAKFFEAGQNQSRPIPLQMRVLDRACNPVSCTPWTARKDVFVKYTNGSGPLFKHYANALRFRFTSGGGVIAAFDFTMIDQQQKSYTHRLFCTGLPYGSSLLNQSIINCYAYDHSIGYRAFFDTSNFQSPGRVPYEDLGIQGKISNHCMFAQKAFQDTIQGVQRQTILQLYTQFY